MSKLISVIAIPLSIIISLKYFRIYDVSAIILYDIVILGALFLIITQIFSYIIVYSYNKGTTFMGKIIRVVIALPGILFFIDKIYPINLGIDLEIVIAMFLFMEGVLCFALKYMKIYLSSLEPLGGFAMRSIARFVLIAPPIFALRERRISCFFSCYATEA